MTEEIKAGQIIEYDKDNTPHFIIDGVDVSGCAFYSKGKCNNPNGMACNCCNNAICYFKERKRLEFENKLLKADYEASEEENAKLKEQIIKLTEEKGNLIINRNTVENKLRDTESRLISVQKANTHNLVLLQRRNNTLEEIRGINNQFFDMNYGFDEQNISYDVKEVAREIQDKINEATNDK